MPGQHARLAPSSSKRWLKCTAAPLYTAALLDAGVIQPDKGSKYADEGTEAHEWASSLLVGSISVDDIPENFRPHILEYQRICLEVEHGAGKDSFKLIEGKVPLFYSPGETGTVDFGFLRVDRKGRPESLHIRDLKYGMGVPVDADENTQLAIYAMSWIVELESWWGNIPDHLPAVIGIHQPRYAGDDSLKLWETTVGDLRAFCEGIANTADEIHRATSYQELEFHPSADTCQFCPAKAVCKARLEHAFTDFPADVMNADLMSNLDLPDIDFIPLETLVSIWKRRKEIVKFIDGAEEFLTALAMAGNPADGTKLVAGREGNRAWKDEAAAAKVLLKYLSDEEAWKKSLISPAAAEKALKGKDMGKPVIESHMVKLTERASGKEVLAPEEDKRPAVMAATDLFSILTDETDT